MKYLSACLIFKNEAHYLNEWIEHYSRIGVEHFYLYDNESSDDALNTIHPWLHGNKVSYFRIDGQGMQLAAYRHCIENFRSNHTWIAFLDIDEFLFSPLVTDIRAVLCNFENEAGLVANWLCFGTSGYTNRSDRPVVNTYTRRCEIDYCDFDSNLLRDRPGAVKAFEAGDSNYFQNPRNYYGQCNHIKSIVNARYVCDVGWSPHHFSYIDNKVPVTATGMPTPGPFTNEVDINSLRINHYFTKSEEEYMHKLRRGRADENDRNSSGHFIKDLAAYHKVVDIDLCDFIAHST